MKAKLLLYVLADLERGVSPHLVRNLLDIQSDRRFKTTIEIPARPWGVCHTRNKAMSMLRDGDYDWLLMCDADQSYQQNPLTVLSAASPRQAVIGFPSVSTLADPDAPQLNLDPQEPCEVDGPFRTVAFVGTGSIAIRREVTKVLSKGPWFEFVYDQTNELRPAKEGEDGFFCDRCWEKGIRVWVPMNVPALSHWKRTDITFFGARINELNLLKAKGATR